MGDQHDELRHLLDDFVDDHTPSAAQARAAKDRLLAEIEAESAAGPRPRLVARIAVAAAVVVAVLIALVPLTRAPAQAALAELAEATRDLPAEELPPGRYIYVATDQVFLGSAVVQLAEGRVGVEYLLPSTVEAWWQTDTVQLTTTVGEPVFFDPAVEAAYYAAGLDTGDQVGQTRTETFTGVSNQLDPTRWSTDPEILTEQLQQAAENNPRSLPIEVEILELAYQLLEPQLLAPPQLRAAIIEVIASLDLEQTRLPDGQVTAAITYQRPAFGTVTLTLTFDPAGHLIKREAVTTTGLAAAEIPPDTTYELVEQTPPAIVNDPGTRPGK